MVNRTPLPNEGEILKSHARKIIAPLLITVIIVLYYVGFAIACIIIDQLPWLIKLLGIVIPLIFAGICIYVLLERIKEIRSGEEDDLSKY